mgnify:CR=1 FL=1
MDKKYKVSMKYKANSQRYQVTKIVGPQVVVPTRGPSTVRVGDWLSQRQCEVLGERAVLTTT